MGVLMPSHDTPPAVGTRAGLLARLLSTPQGVAADYDVRARDGLVQALVRMRRRRGLTQGEAARRMSTTQSAVSELENGVTDARLSTLQRYSRVLGCSLELILREGATRHFTSWEERTLPYKANSRTKVLRGDASAWGFVGGADVVAGAGVPVRLRPRDNDVRVSPPGDDCFVKALDELVAAA
ncbi:helix-turn-helix transcriptional regulator [Actinoplanes sp. NEAU-A12]|uniref:Helix-turn-helix transcriptional regulator n=1 Tax=Actinoplanes sandaracinus TaxID=3045177 RepID=A0ABT6WI52_9ACTN|nr:helix-turn-helix transcriptional regulator [Actinoplanes sandaracinus]MDI6099416.1 helix-turn-helix transcriptional regulator [Actinoplanes sandaracinus]